MREKKKKKKKEGMSKRISSEFLQGDVVREKEMVFLPNEQGTDGGDQRGSGGDGGVLHGEYV